MKVLILGAGGREHGLCLMISRSDSVEEIWCEPGNEGTRTIAKSLNLDSKSEGYWQSLVEKIREIGIDLVIPGGESLLVEGLTDFLEKNHIAVCAPSKSAAMLEGSKSYAKEFCYEFDIPTPKAVVCRSVQEANHALDNWCGDGLVVKADGLAAGKGVVLCEHVEEAREVVEEILGKKIFGKAGDTLLIEEKVAGEEMSFFVISDGERAKFIGTAKDHKRAYDGDKGLNTGGMGVVSPSPLENRELIDEVMTRFVEPTIKGMKERGIPYKGVLFLGLMISKRGECQLLEYNVRLGDPECQALSMRTSGDIFEDFYGAAKGRMSETELVMSSDSVALVVVARNGYPSKVEPDIELPEQEIANNEDEDVYVFHAATKRDDLGRLISSGGRVLGIGARGASFRQAIDRAYDKLDHINWQHGFCRRDIGGRL